MAALRKSLGEGSTNQPNRATRWPRPKRRRRQRRRKKARCCYAGSEADAQAGLSGEFLDFEDLPSVETNEATVFFAADHTMDFVGGEQVAVLTVAETTFWTLELPERPH